MSSSSNERRCTGPLRLGVPDAVVAELGKGQGVTWTATQRPLIVPVQWLPWWSEPFLKKYLAGEPELQISYVDWDLYRSGEVISISDRQSEGRESALWVTEVPDSDLATADRVVREIAAQLGYAAQAVPLLSAEEAIEDYYVLRTRLRTPAHRHLDVRASWRTLVSRGAVRPNDPDGSSLLVDPTAEDIDAVWNLYLDAMQELSIDHPIRAELDRLAFDRMVAGDHGCVVVTRQGGQPVSACLIGVGTELFDWLDLRWFSCLDELMDADDLVVWPAIVTRSDLRNQGHILGLIDLVGELVLGCGSELLIVFPCDNKSVLYTPHIAQAAVDARYPDIWGTVTRAAGYVFRAYRLQGILTSP